MPIRTAIRFSLVTSLVATLASALTAADGPRLVKDITVGPESLTLVGDQNWPPSPKIIEANGLALFLRSDPGAERQTWRSDGTPAGTWPLVSMSPCRLIQVPVRAGDRVFWRTWEPANGYQLWTSDGSAGGTRALALAAAGVGDSANANKVIACAKTAYFIVTHRDQPDFHYSLWSSDGQQFRHCVDLPLAVDAPSLVATRNRLYFLSSANRSQLWSYDTASGQLTQAIFDYPTNQQDSLQGLSTAGDLAYVCRWDGDAYHLWRSDGTTAGTFALHRPIGGFIRQADFNGRLLFVTSDPEHGEEPWISDGTVAGTRMIADLLPGPAGSRPEPLMIAADRAYFITQSKPDPEYAPLQLWCSDGTSAGTRLCLEADLIDGQHHASIGRTLYFPHSDPQHGSELWQCDGTPAGTRRVSDINPGPADSDPWSITEAGGRLFMHATDASHGRELWIHDVDRTQPTLSVATPVRPTAVVTGDHCRFSGTARDAVGVTRLTITLRGATTKQVVIANEPKPDAPVTWDLTLAIQPGITEAMIGAEDEAGNRSVLRRMLVARTTPTSGKSMHVGFLEPTPVVTGRHVSDGPAFPGATVYALDDDGAPATDVTYRYAGGTTRDGTAVSNDDGTWTIAGASLSAGESTLAVTARDADGTSADARLEVVVPQATSQAAPSGNRCGGGSGIAALALLAMALGLRRRT